MSYLKSVLVGTVSGAAVGLLALLAAATLTNSLLQVSVPAGQLLPVLLASGVLAGSLSSLLGNVLSGRERLVLGVLLGTAVAALAVMSGAYSQPGWLPPLVYLLAAAAGVLATPVGCLLGRMVQSQPEPLTGLDLTYQ